MTFIRILLAALAGGLAMFIWGAFDHMVLPTGEMGIQDLPAESLLVPQLKLAIPVHGAYRIPGMKPKDSSEAAKKAIDEKYNSGPIGMLIFDPAGGKPILNLLGPELLSNILCALLLAVIITWVRAGKLAGTLIGAGMGLYGWLSINISYMNWYRFPAELTLAELVDQFFGGAAAGLAVAVVVRHWRKGKMVMP